MTDEEKLRARFAGVLFTLSLCGILVFGLWPFGGPHNDVTWIRDRHAIRLGKRGTILNSSADGRQRLRRIQRREGAEAKS